MKRLFKKLARAVWLNLEPVRQPLVCKFDQHMVHLLNSISARAETPPNLDLALNSVVRELARLQIQMEMLQQQIDDLESSGRDGARSKSRLSVVREIG